MAEIFFFKILNYIKPVYNEHKSNNCMRQLDVTATI